MFLKNIKKGGLITMIKGTIVFCLLVVAVLLCFFGWYFSRNKEYKASSAAAALAAVFLWIAVIVLLYTHGL